mgnify:CR=1 FL=1
MSTIATLLAEARETIAPLDAEALMAHLLAKPRSHLRAWPEHQLDPQQRAAFHQLVARRAAGEPLAYLTGWREFWSLMLQVNRATLIPRPDTELLVEQALNLIPTDAQWRIADLGTGSGAIALAIASERPHCHLVATDICPEALAMAQANAHRLGLDNVAFRQGDWQEALQGEAAFNLIACNPPYIDADDAHLKRDGLPYEPQQALTPGPDGLAALRSIIAQAGSHLCMSGWLLLEHGYNQADAVQTLLRQQGYTGVDTRRDLGDQARLTLGQWRPS